MILTILFQNHLYHLRIVKKYLDNGRTDVEFSNRLASDWNFKNHVVISIPNDFLSIEADLKFINSIFPTPYAHSYLYFSYFLFKYSEENNYDSLVMGDGPDVSMLGTHDLHSDIILTAIKLKQYNYTEAEKISFSSLYLENTAIPLNKIRYNSLLKYVNTTPLYNDNFFYSIWPKKHLPNELESIEFKLKENTLRHRLFAEWKQFIVRTKIPTDILLAGFNFEKISPYLESNLCEFSLSIPAHYKYTLNSTKHLMREVYGKYLPDYILNKERTGFNPNNIWADKYSVLINELLYKYVQDKTKKIHAYINVDHLIKIGEFTFNKKWALINLSIWIEQWL